MPKILIKIVAFLLVPCLFLDPVTASVISSQQISLNSRLITNSIHFEAQAISPPEETSDNPFNIPSASRFRRLLGTPGSYVGLSPFRALYLAPPLEETIRLLIYLFLWVQPETANHWKFIEITLLIAVGHYFVNGNAYRKMFVERWSSEPTPWEVIFGTLAIPFANNVLSLIPLAFHVPWYYYWLFNVFQHHVLNRYALFEDLAPASLLGDSESLGQRKRPLPLRGRDDAVLTGSSSA